jgi:hypothetical protein
MLFISPQAILNVEMKRFKCLCLESNHGLQFVGFRLTAWTTTQTLLAEPSIANTNVRFWTNIIHLPRSYKRTNMDAEPCVHSQNIPRTDEDVVFPLSVCIQENNAPVTGCPVVNRTGPRECCCSGRRGQKGIVYWSTRWMQWLDVRVLPAVTVFCLQIWKAVG